MSTACTVRARSVSPSIKCLDLGTRLWIPCEKQVWRPGVVVAFEQLASSSGCRQRAIVEVQNSGGCERSSVDAQAAGPKGRPSYLLRTGELLSTGTAKAIDDLNLLPTLVEPEILHLLYMRYTGQNIYTFAGRMLLAVNPYQDIPALYDNAQLSRFTDVPHGCPAPAPHIFGVARDAFLGMQHSNLPQTLLVSGESGAGKTESAKHAVRFLFLFGRRQHGAVHEGTEHQVIGSASLLESLGNARTPKNDNASRFSKFVQLHFQHVAGPCNSCVMVAETRTYLLEATRVTDLNEGERCFHIFYQILAAAARASMSAFWTVSNTFETTAGSSSASSSPLLCPSISGLVLPDLHTWTTRKFAYLAKSNCEVLPTCDEAVEFDRTVKAMRDIDMNDDEISQVVGILVAVLHLGNIEFQSASGTKACVVRDYNELGGPLSVASALLGVESESLAAACCTRVLQVQGKSTKQVISKSRTWSQAAECRDSLARHLYNMLFKHIVSKINQATSAHLPDPAWNAAYTSLSMPTIGVLDIFGFQAVHRNCFEQFCINFANEVLEQFFTEVVFEHELTLYDEEGIMFDPHEAAVNVAIAQQRVTDSGAFLEGVFPMLEEECYKNVGSADSWLYRVTMAHGRSNAFRFVHQPKGHFIVHHFAGPVEYCATAFLAKNKDRLSTEALDCMEKSSKTVLQQLFKDDVKESQAQAPWQFGQILPERHTASYEFREQLDGLMAHIATTRPHLVRCIRPNRHGVALSFNCYTVLDQLRSQGMFEAIRVSRAVGFVMRLEHEDAVLTYWRLAPRKLQEQLQDKLRSDQHHDAAQALFEHLKETLLGANGVQVGKALTFFKTESLQVLGIHLRKCREAAALQIQTLWQRCRCLRRFVAMRTAILKLQAAWRRARRRARQAINERTRCALKVQRAWRRHQGGAGNLVSLRESCSPARLLKSWRDTGWTPRHQQALLRLQTYERGRQARTHFRKTLKAVLHIQQCFRSCLFEKGMLLRESTLIMEVPRTSLTTQFSLAVLSETPPLLRHQDVPIDDSMSRPSKLEPDTSELATDHVSDDLTEIDLASGTQSPPKMAASERGRQQFAVARRDPNFEMVYQTTDLIDIVSRESISRLNTLVSSDGEDRGTAPAAPFAAQNTLTSPLSWWQSWLSCTNLSCGKDGRQGLDALCDAGAFSTCPRRGSERNTARYSL